MKIINKFKIFLKDEMILHSAIVFFGTSMAGVFQLLYHLASVRILSPQDYGTFNTLLSFIMFTSMAYYPLTTTLTRFFTEYIAKKEVYNPINIVAMIGSMKQYNSMNLNGFKPKNSTTVDYFFVQRRESAMKRVMLDAYRKRSAFYMPYTRPTFVLNTEELATVYHFPGRVAETPTLGRIEAKKSEPPPSLPI